jgi:hypothetical protein
MSIKSFELTPEWYSGSGEVVPEKVAVFADVAAQLNSSFTQVGYQFL